jgi:hypothetical protein
VRAWGKTERRGWKRRSKVSSRFMSDSWRGARFAAEELPGLGAEGIEEDMFGGTALGLAGAIHAAAPLGEADLDPVGGAITGAREAGRVHQGFQQKRLDLIGGAPVSRKLASGLREEVAGQMADTNPRQNQEAAVIDDLGKVGLASGIRPADPNVAGSHFPGGAGEEQAGQQRKGRLLGADEVAELGAVGNAITEVVIALEILVKEVTIRGSLNEEKF